MVSAYPLLLGQVEFMDCSNKQSCTEKTMNNGAVEGLALRPVAGANRTDAGRA